MYSFIITVGKILALSPDTTDWFCLNFAAPISVSHPDKVCKNDFTLLKDQDLGDYFWVDYDRLIDHATWYNTTDFPTDTLFLTSLLFDGALANVSENYLVNASSNRFNIDNTTVATRVFSGWDTARIEVTFNIGYA